MQALINSLTQQQLNVVISMVDLDCVDWTPTTEQLISAVEMFGYSEQDIMDALNTINAFVFEDDDFECNCNQYEIDMFFESVSTTDLNYEDDFWFAEYCLRTEFLPQSYVVSDLEYDTDFAEFQLYSDLLIHSVDTQVGF